MKKNYLSPKMDYWCYIAGQLCSGVGAKRYAMDSGAPSSPVVGTGSGASGGLN